MPNGYGTMQIYFPVADSALLHFLQEMERGERSAYVRDAIELKRAMDGEETLVAAVVRRVIREELERILARLPQNAAPNFVPNFESPSAGEGTADASDLADFVSKNRF